MQVIKAANEILRLMPHQVDMEAVKKYMQIDISPISLVLLQEVRHCIKLINCTFTMSILLLQIERYNKLVLNITTMLNTLVKSIEGLAVMTIELDELSKCIYEGRLPYIWQLVKRSSYINKNPDLVF